MSLTLKEQLQNRLNAMKNQVDQLLTFIEENYPDEPEDPDEDNVYLYDIMLEAEDIEIEIDNMLRLSEALNDDLSDMEDAY